MRRPPAKGARRLPHPPSRTTPQTPGRVSKHSRSKATAAVVVRHIGAFPACPTFMGPGIGRVDQASLEHCLSPGNQFFVFFRDFLIAHNPWKRGMGVTTPVAAELNRVAIFAESSPNIHGSTFPMV